ncbi:MAG: YiiD C-terminal domain-containing protein [Chthoniobacterales bacterium]
MAKTVNFPSHMTADDLQRLEKFLHEKIPVTRAMGTRIVPDAQTGFAVQAPVALNYNHLHTAFGGSINAIATLAAYAFLWLRVGENCHVVVRESTIKFERPIRKTIRARCASPTADAFRAFDAALCARGRARLELRVSVDDEEAVAAEFVGTFVAVSGEPAAHR